MINKEFFTDPKDNNQRRYEALRAFYVDKLSDKEISEKFGYTYYSFKSLKRDYKHLTPEDFFTDLHKGPKGPHKKTLDATPEILRLRKKELPITDILTIMKKRRSKKQIEAQK